MTCLTSPTIVPGALWSRRRWSSASRRSHGGRVTDSVTGTRHDERR
jgi:hypothetical protein